MTLEPPPIDEDFAYILDLLSEAGTVGYGFSGAVPLSFAEIDAWARLTQTPLTPFEAGAIRFLSSEYCTVANDPERECPYRSPDDQAKKDARALKKLERLR